ncbi:putative pterin-4-alpha-carbinolamine dehydratase [Neptunitalea chrysea]|uniref:Putative pterin-4-alpha-carbinolamine dehydratase n=1 Tax=Neptunitalea chrysea TaxID=1647581 RepID=A0A9W6B5T2_9FLAO|nr:4a-hydroxytetrahydrobiopterin dehydratase [Neptunitalea chrysea]GLB52382.1 putative pterin-4-alpha-carbinolamine dehydratase [Neptunitalea chrysea]
MTKLEANILEQEVQLLNGWQIKNNHLEKTFTFKSFKKAFAFMTMVAFEAEKLNHHPNWTNSYNILKIQLTTHDANGITEKDIALATLINQLTTKHYE